jgi:hypothetical protein
VVDADQGDRQRLRERARRGTDDTEARAQSRAPRKRDRVDVEGVSIAGLGGHAEDVGDDLGDRGPHVLGRLARVDPTTVGLVGVGLDVHFFSSGIVQRRTRCPRGAFESDDSHRE